MSDAEGRANVLLGMDCEGEEGRVDTSRHRDPSGHYAALGISEKATPLEIRRAFLHLSQSYHTDKHVEQDEDVQRAMNDRFQELQDAYAVLLDPKQRAAYDAAGETGVEMLALVPKSIVTTQGIVDYITSLDREAELVRTAKMLSASSDISMNFSTVHIFLPPRARQESGEHAQPFDNHESDLDADVDSEATTNSTQGGSATVSNNPDSGSDSGHDSDTGAEGGEPGTADQQQQVELKEQLTPEIMVIDGKERVVFFPSGELEKRLWERLRPSRGKGERAQQQQLQRSQRLSRRQSFMAMLMGAVVPKSVQLRHSFEHAITPALGVVFRTDARSGSGDTADVSLTTEMEYQQSVISTYAASVRASVRGLKVAVMRERVLSPLWTLRTKHTCLRGISMLQKFELSLYRQLSSLTRLENTIAWSLTENGFFKSSITTGSEMGQRGISTYISYHNMSLTAFTSAVVIYGVNANDPHHKPVRGSVQYSVNCSPFTGQTHLGFEAWYYHSRLQRFGLSFMTVVPYSLSPIAFPFLFVGSAQYAVVNQLSFLYARGQHRISIPVIVFVSRKMSHAALWLSVPMLAYRLARLAYLPVARARTAKYYAQLRRENVAETDIAREKALLEQRALSQIVSKSQAIESGKGGLVIANARYGVLSPKFVETEESNEPPTKGWRPWHVLSSLARALSRQKSSTAGRTTSSPVATAFAGDSAIVDPSTEVDDGANDIPLTIDVTVALQHLVRNSALELPGGTKSRLTGFYDPDPYTAEHKQLRIVYWFQKKKHMVVLNDEDDVELPNREHLIGST